MLEWIYRILNIVIVSALSISLFASAVYVGRKTWVQLYVSFRERWLSAAERRRYVLSREYERGTDDSIDLGVYSQNLIARMRRHLEILLESTRKIRKERQYVENIANQINRFLIVSSSTGVLIYLLVYFATGKTLYPVPFAILGMIAPYSVLRMRKILISINNSYDIVPLIALLLAKLRQTDGKMISALDHTINELPPSVMRENLILLHGRLQNYHSSTEVYIAIERFISTVGTSWAYLLGAKIFKGVVYQYDMRLAIEELNIQITNIQQALSKQKTDRLDTVMSLYLTPIILFTLIGYMQLAVTNQTLAMQFSPAGLQVFLPSAVFMVVGIVYAIFLRKPKQEM